MPGELPGPSEPCLTYSTPLLLHNVLRILAADRCEIVITTGNARPPCKRPETCLPSGHARSMTSNGPSILGSGDARLLPF
jgi:hypothetical protein